MRKHTYQYTIIYLICMLTLTGCMPHFHDDDMQSLGKDNETKQLVVGKMVDLDTMDPQRASDAMSIEAIAAVVDGLFTTNPEGEIIPALAERTEVSEDGLTYTFYLRDANWSNGAPVTAHDFVYAFQRLADKQLNCEYSYMLNVAGIKHSSEVLNGERPVSELGVMAKDDHTFVVVLERPVAILTKLMLMPPFFPVNQAFVESCGNQFGTSPETTLSNGAFVLTQWTPGTFMTFEKNNTYWDADAVGINQLRFCITPSVQRAVDEYERGHVDLVDLSGELVDVYKDNKACQMQLGAYTWWLQLNHYTGKFDNVNLNKAIALAFNREQIAKNVLKDGSVPAYRFVPEGVVVGNEGRAYRYYIGEYFNGTKDDAKAHWEKARAEMGIDTFDVELLHDDDEMATTIARFIKLEIESTLNGVSVKLKSMPKKERLQVVRGEEPDYDIALTRWGADYADPMSFLELYADSENGGAGRGGYSSPQYNALITSAKSGKLTEVERYEVMAEAESYLLESAMGPLPVYQTGGAWLLNPKITGLYHNPVGVKHIYKWVDIAD